MLVPIIEGAGLDLERKQIPERKSNSQEHTPGHASSSCRDWCPLVAPGFPGYPLSCGPESNFVSVHPERRMIRRVGWKWH
jgi:hypothetical protein